MKQFTADSPEVKQALAGIYRGTPKLYFRVKEGGDCEKVNLTRIFRDMGLTFYNIDQIMKAFPFPEGRYDSAQLRAKAAAKGRPKKVKEQCCLDEETLTEEEIEDEVASSRKYSLVRQGKYFGAWDEENCTQTLFHTLEEAKLHIHQLIHGGEVDWARATWRRPGCPGCPG